MVESQSWDIHGYPGYPYISIWNSLKPWGDARIREREAQRAAEATEIASEAEEDLDFEAMRCGFPTIFSGFFRGFPWEFGFSMGVFWDISMGIGFQRDFNGFSMGF